LCVNGPGRNQGPDKHAKKDQGQYPAILAKQASKVNKALEYNVDFDKPALTLGNFFLAGNSA